MIFQLKSLEDKELNEMYQEGVNKLDDFFNLNPYYRPHVTLLDDRNTIDRLRYEKTPSWLVAWTNHNIIYILKREVIESQSNHKAKSLPQYKALLLHELCHAYINHLYRKLIKPRWLIEGLCKYVSGQLEYVERPQKLSGFLDGYDYDYKIANKAVYQESGFAIEYLIEKFGKEKLLLLIDEAKLANSRREFEVLFKNVYGFRPEYSNFKLMTEKVL